MRKYFTALGMTSVLLSGCGEAPSAEVAQVAVEATPSIEVEGRWILDANQQVMQDPQTSGLTLWQGKLMTIADGAADESQVRRLHAIDPVSGQLVSSSKPMEMASIVRNSCFSKYLSYLPDLEALVSDPIDDSIFYTVTEDATRTGALSDACQNKYRGTGSTDYPTLLVRIKQLDDGRVQMDGVRPVKFPAEFEVGNFPNDGIEGLAITPERKLYLGLEKDGAGNPRIFSVQLTDAFWQDKSFVTVQDPKFKVPTFSAGNHPINGMTYYRPDGEKSGYLLAAARNDNELWIIDEAGQKETKKVLFHFTLANHGAENCAPKDVMDNASIEGVEVIGDTLWMVNDPWKKNYLKNIQCDAQASRYQAMAPLIYSTPLRKAWF